MKVEFDRVGMSFPGNALVLKDVSLTIPSGQVCVLLGASGAGKSTLLRCVNGLIRPVSGNVRLGGETLGRENLTRFRRMIGSVHQNYALSPRLSVFQNVLSGALAEISAPASWFGLFPEKIQKKAAGLLESVGLDEMQLMRRAGTLSGGAAAESGYSASPDQ